MAIEDGYSICLNEWALDKNIKNELNLLVIISSLTAKKGYCYASNKWFADLFDIDEVSISRKLKKLEESGYIIMDYKKHGFSVERREIRLTKMLRPLNKNVNRPLTEMLSDDSQDCYPTINKIVNRINSKNTNSKNTNENITNTQKDNSQKGEGISSENTKILEENNQKGTKEPGVPRGVVAPKVSAGARIPDNVKGVIADWAGYPETKKAIEDYVLFLMDTYNFKSTAIKNKITQICRMASNVPQGIEVICRYNIDRNYATPYKPADYKKQLIDNTVVSAEFDEDDFVRDENGNIEEVW